METKAGEARVAETEGGIEKGRKEKKQKEREKKKEENKKKKPKIERIMKVNKIAEEWEILDKEEEAAKYKEEAKKLVPQRFHKWIHVFGKKVSERMLTKKLWDYTIEVKEVFVLRKGKIYLLSREEREEMHEFIEE